QEFLDARRHEIERHKKECERQIEEQGRVDQPKVVPVASPSAACCPAIPEDSRPVTIPPVRPDSPNPLCDDPPDDATVLRSLPPVRGAVRHLYEETGDNIQTVTERLVDKLDPPRFFPLVGQARLHHCRYKCTVYYTETCQGDYPFPFKVATPRVQVVYIDKDHLRVDPDRPSEPEQQQYPGCCCPAFPDVVEQFLGTLLGQPAN